MVYIYLTAFVDIQALERVKVSRRINTNHSVKYMGCQGKEYVIYL